MLATMPSSPLRSISSPLHVDQSDDDVEKAKMSVCLNGGHAWSHGAWLPGAETRATVRKPATFDRGSTSLMADMMLKIPVKDARSGTT